MKQDLPARLSPLVGRETEVADIVGTLTTTRLLTLTGPGGTGKTRLALAAAAESAATIRPAWADLTQVAAGPALGQAVAGSLGVPETPGQDPADAIAGHVADGRRLLILDNCEHVAVAAATLAERLLAACPGLIVLATSREPLGIDGERLWPVPPLKQADAAGLFVLRAQLVHPPFQVTEDNEDTIRHICERLDGLPLAIELAAARLRVLSVTQLAERLDDLLGVLVGGSRSAPPRHQTLRATLDWSHDMLDESERTVFRRLGVFAGGFTLEAAERVCAHPGMLDLLTRLVDKSLVRCEHDAAACRFHLLGTIREYALARLDQTPDAARVRAAHLRYYQELTSDHNDVAHLVPELPNLRAALAYAHASGDNLAALTLASGLVGYATVRGNYGEVRQWLDTALAACLSMPTTRALDALRAKALLGGGRLALLQCDYGPAAGHAEQALERYRALGDDAGAASALRVLASVARELGQYEHAIDLYTESGDVARVQDSLAFVHWLRGDLDQAEQTARTALETHRANGDAEGMASSLIHLGTVQRYRGQAQDAVMTLEKALCLSEELGFREGLAWSLEQLGLARADAGLLVRSLEVHTELRDRWRMASLLDDLAGVALRGGNPARAARLLGAAEAIREAIGTPVPLAERPDRDAIVAGARAALSRDEFESARRQGLTATAADLRADLPRAGARMADSTALQVIRLPRAASAAAGAAGAAGAATSAAAVARASGRVQVTALGGSTVAVGDTVLTAAHWGYAKPRELLFLLVTSEPLGKEQIGAALWPDLAGRQLSNALHTALRELRRALGDPGWVRYADGRYSFDRSRPYSCDVTLFEDALLAARRAGPQALPHLHRAIAAYGGDFLDGFAAGEWALTRRDELRSAFESALLAVGRLEAKAGRHQAAVTAFRRAVAHDPLNESAHRDLMASLVQLGETARAARHYQQLATDLHRQLGVTPAPQTTALYHRLTTPTPAR